MADINGLSAEDVAKTIINVMGWQETARTRWFTMDQERIEHHGDSRWIGVTSSLHHTWVTLHAGRIRDGEFTAPEAESDRLDGTDQAVLALAARRLWERLDGLEQEKSL
ncbi:hypothetical protein FCH28_37680 [Streptomyces piniterrae]|uniref:Uncharacterized protein n=1 Tax=Streptomyces piniterrae TaxID=2571125 RepID=A0A4V5MHN5_9ACTN|nr:hypothetical protein [Streptomyces piniterrae]TJZ41218.1 hypothetical protein FCH28_37680 [Streptomyces piniterrae]